MIKELKELKEELKKVFNKEIIILETRIEEDEFEATEFFNVIINSNYFICEGAYNKWDLWIEDECIEKSFNNEEDLINYLKLFIK